MSNFVAVNRPGFFGYFFIFIFLGLLISGCAFNLATINYQHAELDTADLDALNSFELLEPVVIHNAPCNYDRTLRSNTRWNPVGTIQLGAVFRSNDQVLTVECSHVFETYIVVSGGMLIGGYFPVEDGYIELRKPIEMKVKFYSGEE